jgi:hypothetical protein
MVVDVEAGPALRTAEHETQSDAPDHRRLDELSSYLASWAVRPLTRQLRRIQLQQAFVHEADHSVVDGVALTGAGVRPPVART